MSLKGIASIDSSKKVFSNRVVYLDLHELTREIRERHPTMPIRHVCDFITLVGNESIASGRRFNYTSHHLPFTSQDAERVSHELLTRLTQLFGSLNGLSQVHKHFIFQVTHRRSPYPRIALADARSDKAIKNISSLIF